MFYGPSGIGKTSFAANVPGVVFLVDEFEDGITTLKGAGLVPPVPVLPVPKSWADVLGILEQLATDQHDYKALAIDTLKGFEKLCHIDVCSREFAGEWGDKGFESYQKGYKVAIPIWAQFIRTLDRLRDERGMSIILMAHAQVSTFKNPEGADYDRYSPDIHKETWNFTERWAEMVLFANFLTVVDQKKNAIKGKAHGGRERFIYTEHHASYNAKNRHNLPAEISMGDSGSDAWTNLMDAIKASRAWRRNQTNDLQQ